MLSVSEKTSRKQVSHVLSFFKTTDSFLGCAFTSLPGEADRSECMSDCALQLFTRLSGNTCFCQVRRLTLWFTS